MKPFAKLAYLLLFLPLMVHAEGDDITWNSTLKNQFFAGKTVEESDAIIELEVPYRAEDPAIVPAFSGTK